MIWAAYGISDITATVGYGIQGYLAKTALMKRVETRQLQNTTALLFVSSVNFDPQAENQLK